MAIEVEYGIATNATFWCIKGTANTDPILHREDGPSVIYTSNNFAPEWWYHGEFINCKTQEEFARLIKLKAFW